MRGLLAVPICIAVTALSWGTYGVAVHVGQYGLGTEEMDADTRKLVQGMFAFMCVGIAYFLVAVLIPLIRLKTKGEKGSWTVRGTVTSTVAGAVGAVGALGIVIAFGSGGSPIYVMPLVFGGAPVVNTFVSMVFAKAYRDIRPVFLVGLALVVTGAVLVLVYTPSVGATTSTVEPNWGLIIGAIFVTALCWGSYGPVLHKGQAAMGGSRLRPFVCVGLAYIVVAVIAPTLWLSANGISLTQGWTGRGVTWALVGGGVGAIGALGIIFAFNYGGKPVFVMPLVFGGAPVVNTFTKIAIHLSKGDELTTPSMFFVGLGTVIVGAVLTLVFAPRGGKPATAAKTSEATATATT
ncbi:MAG: hypothetical protein MPJ50_12825 [Pirellulales bacterium]|nr:hypothetical protein [Pirellulales bacterium]